MERINRNFGKKFYPRNWKIHFTRLIILIFHFISWSFAMLPVRKRPIVSEIYKFFWLLEICITIFLAFYNYNSAVGAKFSLGGLVISLLFLTQILAHLTALWDSFAMRHKWELIYNKVDKLTKRLLESNLELPIDTQHCAWKLSLILLSIFVQLGFWHTLIGWIRFQVFATGTVLFWYGFLSSIALQVRILEFLSSIVYLNDCLLVLRNNINKIGERNLNKIFKPTLELKTKAQKRNFLMVKPIFTHDEDERQLIVLKSLHNDIFYLFQILNDCYGWSLLAFTALYFIDFVTNSYWLVLAMITQGRNNLAFLQTGGFLYIVIVMLSIICWHCQKSYDYSRQIGCLIFKLVKPLGNKRYNDLVSEFSLQTMHQQFVITAKEFFNLNLNLLGSMVAAIVTYLVILIQFMFTEKSNLERALSTMATPLNVTTTMSTLMASEGT